MEKEIKMSYSEYEKLIKEINEFHKLKKEIPALHLIVDYSSHMQKLRHRFVNYDVFKDESLGAILIEHQKLVNDLDTQINDLRQRNVEIFNKYLKCSQDLEFIKSKPWYKRLFNK